jgi:hypothetical protein
MFELPIQPTITEEGALKLTNQAEVTQDLIFTLGDELDQQTKSFSLTSGATKVIAIPMRQERKSIILEIKDQTASKKFLLKYSIWRRIYGEKKHKYACQLDVKRFFTWKPIEWRSVNQFN